MNIMGLINKAIVIREYLLVGLILISLVSIGSSSGLTSALKGLCTMSQQFLGIAAMLLIVLAGAIYAIGQILGAETRARATVWATAMLTGAVIGIIIYILAPVIIVALVGKGDASKPCEGVPLST